MTSTNTRRTLAEFAAKNVPSKSVVEIVIDGEAFDITVHRLELQEILAIEGMRDLMSGAKPGSEDGDTDFVSEEDVPQDDAMIDKLPVIDRFLAAVTKEEIEAVRVIPLAARMKLFTYAMQFQRVSGGEFRGPK